MSDALQIDIKGIPEGMRRERRWTLWQLRPNPGKPKPDKVPVSHAGRPIDRHDSTNWLTFQEALAAYQQGRFDGLGFVLGGGFIGYNHDACRDPQTGAINDEVREVIAALDSYTEASPSGQGVHVIVKGDKLPGFGRRKDGHELYDDQFFTVTGQHIAGTPTDVRSRRREVAALHARIFGTTPSTGDPTASERPAWIKEDDVRGTENIPEPIALTDDEVIARASAAANGEKFRRLYGGDRSGYPSRSEADQALCNLIAFWTQRDPVRIDALFRRSGLFRPKWDERRGAMTYGQRTVARAIAVTHDIYVVLEGRPLETGYTSRGLNLLEPPTPAELERF